jgi:hypothetical protein
VLADEKNWKSSGNLLRALHSESFVFSDLLQMPSASIIHQSDPSLVGALLYLITSPASRSRILRHFLWRELRAESHPLSRVCC